MRIAHGVLALMLLAAPALAQPTGAPTAGDDPRGGRDPSLSGEAGAARDGCVNVPGVPHNSADCSRLPANDPHTANAASTDLSGKPTGATENAARNAAIAAEQGRRQ